MCQDRRIDRIYLRGKASDPEPVDGGLSLVGHQEVQVTGLTIVASCDGSENAQAFETVLEAQEQAIRPWTIEYDFHALIRIVSEDNLGRRTPQRSD